MTKAELVKAIAAQTGIEAVTVATVVEQMMEEDPPVDDRRG